MAEVVAVAGVGGDGLDEGIGLVMVLQFFTNYNTKTKRTFISLLEKKSVCYISKWNGKNNLHKPEIRVFSQLNNL